MASATLTGMSGLRHVREVRPLHFPDSEPEDEKVVEGREHFRQRTLLFEVLRHNFGDRATVGCDQYVYFNARDPRVNCAPDVFLKLDRPDADFRSWKTWERGVPELAVEIVSPTENAGADWTAKLERYHELGVRELVRFDPEEMRLRIWDRIEDDLVERVVEGQRSPCVTLGLWWTPWREEISYLRLANAEGELLPTPLDAEKKKLAAEKKKSDEAARRIADLEAQLVRR
jgi:Uma2 family endonuclease